MARISLITDEIASEAVKREMEEHAAKGYRITNMKRTLLHSIPAFRSLECGVYDMQEKLETFLDKRTVVFFGYAISTTDECIVCSTYFRKILEDWKIDFDDFAFTDTEELLMKLGGQIAGNKGNVEEELLDELQQSFSEEQVVDLVAFAVMIIANNLFNNTLDVQSELLE